MKTYKLPFVKTLDAVSFDQLEDLRNAGDVRINTSASQIMKRMDQSLFYEIMCELENGESVEING